jgi:hypothetical protein
VQCFLNGPVRFERERDQASVGRHKGRKAAIFGRIYRLNRLGQFGFGVAPCEHLDGRVSTEMAVEICRRIGD